MLIASAALFLEPGTLPVLLPVMAIGSSICVWLLAEDDSWFAPPGGEIKLPTVPAHRDALGAVPNKAITLGVRPQAIQVVPQSSRAKNLIDAEVEIFEALGSTGVLVARSAGLPMTALTAPDLTFDHGEPVRLKIAPEGMLFFDSHSGANLLAR